MLTTAAAILAITALVGVCLIALAQYGRPSGAIWLPGAAHGTLGVIGFIVLLLALRGPPRGAASGSASFGLVAAVLIAAGLITAASMPVLRARGREVPAMILGIHATLAVAGLVMLAAYLSG
jgi:hypothetical protein